MGMRGGGCLLQSTAGMGGGTGVRFGGILGALLAMLLALVLKLFRRLFFIFPEDYNKNEEIEKSLQYKTGQISLNIDLITESCFSFG